MKSIIVDDEKLMIDTFKRTTADIASLEMVGEFSTVEEALKYCRNHPVEVAFLDIEVNGGSGIDLAKALKKISEKMIIIFISGHSHYIKESNLIGADYYLLKPYKKSEIHSLFEKIKYLSSRLKKEVRIETFGKFEVFVKEQLVLFDSLKAKELLAFLVDNGGRTVHEEEAFGALWENTNYTHNNAGIYRNTLKKLKSTLEKYGIGDLIEVSKQGVSLNRLCCECDMFLFFEGDKKACSQYYGEYLNDYSWGEKTNAKLYFSKNNKNYHFNYDE